jgi:hypothetical protein
MTYGAIAAIGNLHRGWTFMCAQNRIESVALAEFARARGRA